MQLRLSTVNLLIVCSFGLYTSLNHFSHKKNSFASVFGRHSYNGFKTTPTLRNNYPILFAALPDIICGITNTICGITRYDLRHYPILFAALPSTICGITRYHPGFALHAVFKSGFDQYIRISNHRFSNKMHIYILFLQVFTLGLQGCLLVITG